MKRYSKLRKYLYKLVKNNLRYLLIVSLNCLNEKQNDGIMKNKKAYIT